MSGAATQIVEEKGQEVLTRGPIHEAFGKPVNFDAEAGMVVAKQPPEAIEELSLYPRTAILPAFPEIVTIRVHAERLA